MFSDVEAGLRDYVVFVGSNCLMNFRMKRFVDVVCWNCGVKLGVEAGFVGEGLLKQVC